MTPRAVLVVAAHPDDEALGCGGTIAKLAGAGATVCVAFIADGISARMDSAGPGSRRSSRPAGPQPRRPARSSAPGGLFRRLPDNRLVPYMLSLVQYVET